MKYVLRASLMLLAALVLAMPLAGQGGRGARPVSRAQHVLTESISVPVFPGQQLTATLSLPTLESTPLPAVLVLTSRDPRGAPAPAALALTEALLSRGVAVVRLDLPPAAAESAVGSEPLSQPADDAFAVLQFVREREDVDGDRLALAGVGSAAGHAARAAVLDEATRALALLGAESIGADTLGLPAGLPLLSLPLEMRAAPDSAATGSSPVDEAAAFLAFQLQ